MEEFAFIDMHIHTEYSRKEPVRQTVKDLLDKLQAMAEKEGKPVAFSISDHESILGCKEATELIKANPEKYNLLKFIPGIEFSTSLKRLGVDKDGQSIYKHCHILGYGYDVNDKELTNFSKIIYQRNTHPTNKGIYLETGYSMVTAKKLLEQKFNKKVPFANLEEVIRPELNHAQVFDIFVDVMARECETTREKVESTIAECFTREKAIGDDALYTSKQGILDIIDMIHSAGGYVCVAHADSIKFKKPELFERVGDKKHYAFVDLVNTIQTMTHGKGIDAMELFHNENTDSMAFFKIQRLAKKYNLYFTAGSDTHSPNINGNMLAKCACNTFEKATLPQNTKYVKGDMITRVVSLPFVDKLVYGIEPTNKQDFLMESKYQGRIDKKKANEIVQTICSRRQAKKEAEKVESAKPVIMPKITKAHTTPKVNKKNKPKKYHKKKKLILQKEKEYNADDYYHAFSGSMKRYYAEEKGN